MGQKTSPAASLTVLIDQLHPTWKGGGACEAKPFDITKIRLW